MVGIKGSNTSEICGMVGIKGSNKSEMCGLWLV